MQPCAKSPVRRDSVARRSAVGYHPGVPMKFFLRHRRSFRATVLALIPALAIVAAACGGGSSGEESIDLDAVPTATLPAELPEPVIIGGGAVLPGGGATYTIQSGDTFSSIAAQFDTTVEQLIAANPGVDPRGLVSGDTIRLPEPADGQPPPPPPAEEPTEEPEPEPTEEPEPTSTPEPAPTNTPSALGQSYVIQSGDIPVDIATRFGITVEALLAANPGMDSGNLQVGQVIIIPPAPTPAAGG
jgi:LysM repeat protein